MTDQTELPEQTTPPTGVGPQLRAARERQGLTVEQVAAETRIPQRHVLTIEAGEFSTLPGRSYAMGFARTMAKTVGLDPQDVAEMVRAEMDAQTWHERPGRQTFEPGDPARAPSRGLVWFSIFAVVVLLAGIFFAARTLFAPAAEMPSLVEQQEQSEAEALAARRSAAAKQGDSPAAPDPAGPVVFTAQGEAWVRFYDAQGRIFREGTLVEGDSFTVPADADGPQIITGRPDLLAITIGGRAVPKLSEELETLTDVPVSAEALLARGDARPAATPSPAAPPGPAASAPAT